MRIEYAPQEHIYQHPDLLAEVVRTLCSLEPADYVVSDESVLSDLIDLDETDHAALYAALAERYGVIVQAKESEPSLWKLVDQIATSRRDHGHQG
jgi:hypothetical protein